MIPNTATVCDVKAVVSEMLDVPFEKIRILFHSKILEDSVEVRSIGCTDDDPLLYFSPPNRTSISGNITQNQIPNTPSDLSPLISPTVQSRDQSTHTIPNTNLPTFFNLLSPILPPISSLTNTQTSPVPFCTESGFIIGYLNFSTFLYEECLKCLSKPTLHNKIMICSRPPIYFYVTLQQVQDFHNGNKQVPPGLHIYLQPLPFNLVFNKSPGPTSMDIIQLLPSRSSIPGTLTPADCEIVKLQMFSMPDFFNQLIAGHTIDIQLSTGEFYTARINPNELGASSKMIAIDDRHLYPIFANRATVTRFLKEKQMPINIDGAPMVIQSDIMLETRLKRALEMHDLIETFSPGHQTFVKELCLSYPIEEVVGLFISLDHNCDATREAIKT